MDNQHTGCFCQFIQGSLLLRLVFSNKDQKMAIDCWNKKSGYLAFPDNRFSLHLEKALEF
jgi:hypothetical protein